MLPLGKYAEFIVGKMEPDYQLDMKVLDGKDLESTNFSTVEINQILFNHIEEMKQAASNVVLDTRSEAEELINTHSENLDKFNTEAWIRFMNSEFDLTEKRSNVARIERATTEYLEKYLDYYNRLNTLHSEIREIEEMVAKSDGETRSVQDEIKAVVANNPFFKLDSIDVIVGQFNTPSVRLYLHTRGDITLFDREGGRNATFNFGRFVVRLEIMPTSSRSKVRVRLMDLSGNTVDEGYSHPHITSLSKDSFVDLCWGEQGAEMLAQAVATRNFSKVLKIVEGVLTTYNPGSPYRRIDDFIRRKERNEAIERGDVVLNSACVCCSVQDDEEERHDDDWCNVCHADSSNCDNCGARHHHDDLRWDDDAEVYNECPDCN